MERREEIGARREERDERDERETREERYDIDAREANDER